jgi:replicative DNA helicase
MNIEEIIKEFREQQALYKKKFASGGGLIGISTGIDRLDEIIDGLRPAHFWVIGGYTNVGKTFAALNIAVNLIRQGKRVVVFSLEMAHLDVLARLLGIMTNQSSNRILKAYTHDEKAVEEACQLLIKSNLVIHTMKSELKDICHSMTDENRNKPVDLFIVDFLQIVTVEGARSEYEVLTKAALKFQQAAKVFKCPVIAISQISNEGARNPDSEVMSFKGSGAIAAAADLAIEIVRNQSETREEFIRKLKAGEPVSMNWAVRKNRHGRVGSIDMTFDGRTGIFKLSDFEKI